MEQEQQEENSVINSIGEYKVLKKIGGGGMGDVYLAFDPRLERRVAIKKMKPKIAANSLLKERFIREAKICSHLFHPTIIPILHFEEGKEETFFVMPHIEGTSLRVLLRKALQSEKEKTPLPPIFSSLSSLIRLFLRICEGVAYAHSQNILHRDIKPENILVGNFGEVYLMDWGLAAKIGEHDPSFKDYFFSDEEKEETPHLTKPGKVLGTLSYLAPERVFGKPANEQSDIFALGVVLYQLLTLRLPYYKKNMKDLRKLHMQENIFNAMHHTPHRDIPQSLALCAKKCLMPSSHDRYPTVEDLIKDLHCFLSGDFTWNEARILSLNREDDWCFQDSLQLDRFILKSPLQSIASWGFAHLSKETFSGNIKLSLDVDMQKNSEGIGIILCHEDLSYTKPLMSGYHIWIGSEKSPGLRLEYDFVPLLDVFSVSLSPGKHKISIEKIEERILCMIDEKTVFDFESFFLAFDGHIGILQKDFQVSVTSVAISIASQKAQISCLCIPDTFYKAKHFDTAAKEYEKIFLSLFGTKESKEALFRKGLSILERAKEKKELYASAHEIFDHLIYLGVEPLAYLGKSLLYAQTHNFSEEVKAFEIGLKRSQKHPLLFRLQERLSYRLHELGKTSRKGVMELALPLLRFAPSLMNLRQTHMLIHSLIEENPFFPFLNKPKKLGSLDDYYTYLSIQIAFYLHKPAALQEISRHLDSHSPLAKMVTYALIELGHSPYPIPTAYEFITEYIITEGNFPVFFYALKKMLTRKNSFHLLHLLQHLQVEDTEYRDCLFFIKIWALLLTKQQDLAKKLFYEAYPQEDPRSPFFLFHLIFFLLDQGVQATRKKYADLTTNYFPPMQYFLLYFLEGKCETKTLWFEEAYDIEKRELYRQVTLLYACQGKKHKAAYFERKVIL